MEPHRIELAAFHAAYDGDWVEIRPKKSWADKKRIDQAALVVTPDSDAAEGYTAAVDLVEQGIAKLSAITAWSLHDSSQAMLPPSREGFLHDDFDPGLGEWLIDQIDAYYDGLKRTDAERKPSAGISIPS